MKNRCERRFDPDPDPDPATADAGKVRRCLMCGVGFASAWAGERICQKCRSRSVWREGNNWPSGGRSS